MSIINLRSAIFFLIYLIIYSNIGYEKFQLVILLFVNLQLVVFINNINIGLHNLQTTLLLVVNLWLILLFAFILMALILDIINFNLHHYWLWIFHLQTHFLQCAIYTKVSYIKLWFTSIVYKSLTCNPNLPSELMTCIKNANFGYDKLQLV